MMLSLAGFEPTAFRLGGGRSILLSYRDKKCGKRSRRILQNTFLF